MSNRRRPPVGNTYRAEFLRSRAWFARRARWFRNNARTSQPLVCVGCNTPGTAQTLQLHHLDYIGVTRRDDGTWQAWEADDDLIPLCSTCHDLVHRRIDGDYVLAQLRTRRDATLTALDAIASGPAETMEVAP